MDWINLSDIQVNSVLGQLRVIGDVGRDVLLTLSDPGASPVSIQVGGGDDDIYIMMKCMCVTKNHHFLLGVSCNHLNHP